MKIGKFGKFYKVTFATASSFISYLREALNCVHFIIARSQTEVTLSTEFWITDKNNIYQASWIFMLAFVEWPWWSWGNTALSFRGGVTLIPSQICVCRFFFPQTENFAPVIDTNLGVWGILVPTPQFKTCVKLYVSSHQSSFPQSLCHWG